METEKGGEKERGDNNYGETKRWGRENVQEKRANKTCFTHLFF